jgi:hypothetical protein
LTTKSSQRLRQGVALATAGLACLVTAAGLAWKVGPGTRELAVGAEESRHFAGTAKVLLNPTGLSTGDVRKAVLRDTPVTSDRIITVLANRNHVAQVSDARSLNVDGATLGVWDATYVVDRTTREAATDAPPSWQVPKHEGLTASWPAGAEKKNYVAWISPTTTSAPITYLREETIAGHRAYVYQIATEPTLLVDELVRARLPWAMSTVTLADLAAHASLTADERAQLRAALPGGDYMHDIDYTYQLMATYWVEPDTGTVLKTDQREVQKVGPILDDKTLAVVPIYDVSLTSTDASVKEAADRAASLKRQILWYGTLAPWILVMIGGIGIVTGGLLIMRRRVPAIRDGGHPSPISTVS